MATKILRNIDLDHFKIFQEKYRSASPDPGYSKYLDIKTWLKFSLHYYYALNLHRSGPLRILDIGTGCGYFPYICNQFGHRTIAIDLDNVDMYGEITAFLKIDRRIFRINAYEELPDFCVKFDLVTAFLVCFNNHGTAHVWGPDEWSFFLKDITRNQLDTSSSRLFLLLNNEPTSGNYEDKLRFFFREKGAYVSDNRIYFDTMDAFLK